MASEYEWVSPGIKKKGKDYFLDYRDTEGRRIREKVGPSRQLAETVYKKRMVEKAENKLLDIKKPKKILLKEFIPKYLDYAKNNKSLNMYLGETYSTATLAKFFNNKYIGDITLSDIEEFKKHRLQTVKESSVNRELSCLFTMLNIAVEWGELPENPIKKLKKLKEPPGRVRYLNKEEIPHLIDACAPHIKPIVFTALNTGLRKQEILTLKWKDIDIEEGFIHINKSKNSERKDIPVNPQLSDLLTSLREKKEDGSEYVFGHYGDIKKGFMAACRRAGIEDFTFHDLRHTFASHLVMMGVSIVVVKELLGHKKLEMTLRYAHLAPDIRKCACEAIGEMIGHFLDTDKK